MTFFEKLDVSSTTCRRSWELKLSGFKDLMSRLSRIGPDQVTLKRENRRIKPISDFENAIQCVQAGGNISCPIVLKFEPPIVYGISSISLKQIFVFSFILRNRRSYLGLTRKYSCKFR